MIMVRTYRLMLLLLGLLALAATSRSTAARQAQTTPPPQVRVAIYAPLAGQPVQGTVVILGNSDVPGFRSAELWFSSADDPTHTWFLIEAFDRPIATGSLALWDTSTIRDGIYILRLSVFLDNGSQSSAIVSSVRVQNESETSTPTPVTPTATPTETTVPTTPPTPTPTPIPSTSTPLPPNPVQLSDQDLLASLGKGALATVGVFALLGLYATAGRLFRRK